MSRRCHGVWALLCLLMAAACAPAEESPPESPHFVELGRALDETCTRNPALLAALKTTPRVCNFDEDCPWGSHCSRSTKVCTWECLEGGTGATACASPQVCGCDGRCGVPGGAVSSPTMQAVLATEPLYLSFTPPTTTGGVWKAQSLDVSLTVNTLAEVTEAAKVSLRVVAGTQMEVSCEASGSGTFGAECTLGSSWTFKPIGPQQQATRRVWARPAAGSTQQTWEVLLEGAGVTPRRLRVSAELAPPSGTSSAPILEFQGHVSLEVGQSTTSYVAANSTPAPLVRLPVRAWANSTSLLLYDESRTLSPTGTLRLSNSRSAYEEFSWLPSKTALASPETNDAMTAVVYESTFTGPPPSGKTSLSGRFSLVLPQGRLQGRYSLSLERGATVTTCSASQPCAAGYVCEPGPQVCVPGDKPWAPLSQGSYYNPYGNSLPRNTIVHEQRKAWEDTGTQKLTQGLSTFNLSKWQLSQGLLCNSGNGSAPTVQFGRDVLTYSGDLACANGAPPYTANLFTQKDRKALSGTPELNSAQMMQACFADVRKLPSSSMPTDVNAWFTERLKNPEQCLSPARLFDTLTLIGRNPSMREDRLVWYLMQQWVGTHAFLARQALQQADAADFLGTQPTSVTLPQMSTVLEQLESGWELLLDNSHDFFSSYASQSSLCGLRNPDYRLPVRPLTTWRNTSVGLELTRGGNLPYSGDLTLFWYGDWTQQNTCRNGDTRLCSETNSCGRCEIGFYNVLSYGEADDGDYFSKFYIHKNTYDYIGGPGEYLVAEEYDFNTGQRSYARWWLDFLSDRPADMPLVVRRQSGQYHMYDKNLAGQNCSPPSACYPLQPPTDTSDWGETLPSDGDTFRIDDPSTKPSQGIAMWDHAITEAELAQMTTRPLSEYLTNPSPEELLPPAGNRSHHEQGVGLPTAMLESMTAHLELLNAEMTRVGRLSYKYCQTYNSDRAKTIERFGRTLRYSMVLETRAAAAVSRQGWCAMNQGMPWEARWKRARAELDAVRTRSLEQFRQLTACEPLGISEDEAPLHFRSVTGASERFFASSDYIFSYAEQALTAASNALDAARTAWDQARTSAIQQQLTEDEAARRMEQLKAQYGRPLVEMCGLEIDAKDALAAFDPSNPNALQPESCYIAKAKDPSCNISPNELYAAVTREDARYTLCVWNGIKSESEANLGSPFAEVAAAWATAEVAGGYVTGGGKSFEVRYLYQTPLTINRLPEAKLAEVQQSCSQALGGIYSLPAPSDIGRKMGASCYRGEMGTAALNITAAHQSLLVARSSWGDAQERYDIANQQCVAMEQRNEEIKQTLIKEHADLMWRLRKEKARLDRIINGVDGVSRTLQTAQTGAMIGAQVGGVYGAVAGAAIGAIVGIFGSSARDKAIKLQRQIEQAEADFQRKLLELEMDEAVKRCFENARVQMIGIKTAALQADRAMTDVDLALLNLQNMESRVRQLIAEGNVAVAREAARTVPSIAHHYWLDERIERAKSAFEWARRLAYVLTLSLEHEKQQSLTTREEVVAAANASMLNLAFDKLRPTQFDRKVNGKAPGEANVTLSMAIDVLKLGDLSNTVEGERTLLIKERFARRLLSPENAVFDKNGHYIGQGFRFSMPQLVGLNHRCAERLWSVRANVVANELDNWTISNGAQLLLYKRNTFQSHWCGGLGDGSAYQSRVYHPSLDVTGMHLTHQEGETSAFSTASLHSTLNKGRDEWQAYECTAQYGCSYELAGRGFYGEYLLVFPYEGLIEEGFNLGAVEDVLLRFEVVSIDNSPPPVFLTPGHEQSGATL